MILDISTQKWLEGLRLGPEAMMAIAAAARDPRVVGALYEFRKAAGGRKIVFIRCGDDGLVSLSLERNAVRCRITVIGFGAGLPGLSKILDEAASSLCLVVDRNHDAFIAAAVTRDFHANPAIEELLVEGVEPEPAKPASVNLQVQPFSKKPNYAKDDEGNVDFFHPNLFQNVVADQQIGEHIPASPGLSGRDVFGAVIDPPEGEKLPSIQCGGGVVFDDKTGRYYASQPGYVVFEDRRLKVERTYVVEGSVDFNVGHINFVADVIVRGDVLPDFSVRAGGALRVCGTVSGAELVSEKEMQLELGMLGQGKGVIKTNGGISCKFINDCVCESAGNVEIAGEALNSRIGCLSRVIAPKAVVIGGRLSALNTMEVGTIGSELGIRTEIFLGEDFRYLQKTEGLRENILSMHERAESLFRVYGDDIASWQEPRETPADQDKMESLHARLTDFLSLLNDLQLAMQEYKLVSSKTPEGRDPACVVRKAVHPETVFFCRGSMLEVKEYVKGPVEVREKREGVEHSSITMKSLAP